MTMAGMGPQRRAARQRQRRLAVIACSLWALCFEVLPNLHLGLHDHLAPHRHDGDAADAAAAPAGPRIKVSYQPRHRHSDGSYHVDASAADTGYAAEGEHAKAPRPTSRHGAHSLAHRALALHTPPRVITEPLPVTRTIAWLEPAIDVTPYAAPAPVAAARGPPAT
jgi:hypothetical protein